MNLSLVGKPAFSPGQEQLICPLIQVRYGHLTIHGYQNFTAPAIQPGADAPADRLVKHCGGKAGRLQPLIITVGHFAGETTNEQIQVRHVQIIVPQGNPDGDAHILTGPCAQRNIQRQLRDQLAGACPCLRHV